MADNTVFDSVFKTMVHRTPRLMIPFINEVFGRNYPQDSEIIPFTNEREGLRGTIVDDSVFRLEDKIYHVECQSTHDDTMVMRMIEYDFAIAFEKAFASGSPYEMDFPASCVLVLRHTPNTPDVLRMKVNLPDGGSFEYQTKVVKAQQYSSDELFEKRLLLLLPYYLMRYERMLGQIAQSDDQTAHLIAECMDIRMRLADEVKGDDGQMLNRELTELIIRVSDHITARYDGLQRKVRAAMGGEVLELLTDKLEKAERLALEAEERGREAEARGLERGLEQGIEQGIEQGMKQSLAGITAKLEELGVDKDLVAQAVAAVRAEQAAS